MSVQKRLEYLGGRVTAHLFVPGKNNDDDGDDEGNGDDDDCGSATN